MPDNDSQFSSLGEKTKLINSALKYTNGDVEKARMMVAGQFNDDVVLKGKFSIEQTGIYGIFIIFVNVVNRYVLNVNSLISNRKSLFDKARVNDNWKSFYVDFKDFVNNEGDSAISSYDFTNHLIDSLDGYDVFDEIKDKNIESLTGVLREIISKFKGMEKIQCQLNLEETNSLYLENEGIPIELPHEDEEIPAESTESSLEAKIENIEKQAEFIVEGRIIVSPVKGKYINDIKKGENIRVLFTNKDDNISLNIAKSQNAFSKEGDYLPVKARIKEKIPLEEGGFIIYAVVARNVLVKIVEEENVKIEMEALYRESKSEKGDGRTLLYLAILIGLLLIALIILYKII